MLLINIVMMGFSLAAALLAQPTLAVITGTGCVSLSGHIARRLLS